MRVSFSVPHSKEGAAIVMVGLVGDELATPAGTLIREVRLPAPLDIGGPRALVGQFSVKAADGTTDEYNLLVDKQGRLTLRQPAPHVER